jgi:SAM-dependent methyltransferase
MSTLYDDIGKNYADYRRPDPRVAAALMSALGNARKIVNIGAGTGSYEPADRDVIAVEPSQTMIRQRVKNSAPVVRVSAMNLPFSDDAFDAALAIFTVHHWPDQLRGLREMSRVAKLCVILTWDNAHNANWLTRDYFPEIIEQGQNICPPLALYEEAFAQVDVCRLPVPHDCSDGFLHAYWQRPEAYFDPGVRNAISAFATIDANPGLAFLRRDLDNGTWMRRNGHLTNFTEHDAGYRIVVARRDQIAGCRGFGR